MILLGLARAYGGWFVTLVRRLLHVAPVQTFLAVPCLLAAQVSLIIAMFMPLKLLVVVGAGRVPRYFRPFFGDMEHDVLVLVLLFVMIGSYALYLASNKIAARAIDSGAERIRAKADKLIFLPDQETVCRSFYESVCESLSAALFISLALILGMFIYPGLFLFIGGGVLASFLAVAALSHFKLLSMDWLHENNGSLVDTLSILVFFGSIGFVIAQFLAGSAPNFLIALISVLIVRRFINSASDLVSGAVKLDKRRAKIDALFMPHVHFVAHGSRLTDRFWASLDRQERDHWLLDLLAPLSDGDVRQVASSWRDMSQREPAGLDAQLLGPGGKEVDRYFVKVFPSRQGIAAAHESSLLLEDWARGLPAPRLLLPAQLDTLRCLVFEAVPAAALDAQRKELAADLMAQCWSVAPPPEMVDQYARSKPMLPARFSQSVVQRLKLAANTVSEAELVAELNSRVEDIQERLRSIPMFVYNPNLTTGPLFEKDRRIFSLDWSNWSIEPLGVGFRRSGDEPSLVEYCLAEASAERRDLRRVDAQSIRLAADLASLMRQFERNQLQAAIAFIPTILGLADGTVPREAVAPKRLAAAS